MENQYASVCSMEKQSEDKVLRYTLLKREQDGKTLYSVKAVYSDEERSTESCLKDVSENEEKALAFCELLFSHWVTPLSMEDIYEDFQTPDD